MLLKENDEPRREVNADIWHSAGYTGKGVTIVLLDDGGLPREHMKDYYANVGRKADGVDHSTNVGYSAHTAAPGTKIYALDAKRDFDEAFEWLTAHKAEIDVINISLAGIAGSTTSKYQALKSLGIPVVCASGNDSYDDKISYPANYDFTIGIGAYAWRNDNVAYYSNGGADLDAVAPSGIYMLRDDGHVFAVNGTSFASPFACGLLACYIQWRNEHGLPKLSPEGARQFIHDNCIDIREKGFDYASGYGLFCLPKEVPTPVEVKPEPVPSKPAEPAPNPTDVFYRVVTGSFNDKSKALQRVADIKAKCGASSFLLAETVNGKTFFRVITGSFADRANSVARIDYLRGVGFDSFIAIYKK
jgi:Subtilase family/SPOR domain